MNYIKNAWRSTSYSYRLIYPLAAILIAHSLTYSAITGWITFPLYILVCGLTGYYFARVGDLADRGARESTD